MEWPNTGDKIATVNSMKNQRTDLTMILVAYRFENQKKYTSGPYFIKVKIFLKSGFKMNWSSYVLANSLNFEFLLTLMLILFTVS